MSYYGDISRVASTLKLDRLSGKNILVTGATGLIGSCVVKMLMSYPKIDYEVFAVGRNNNRLQSLFGSYSSNRHFHSVVCDIVEPIKYGTDFNFIIHAASYSSPAAFVSAPVEVIKSNIIGLTNLFDYGIRHKLIKLLYVSSGEIYGQGDGRPFDESDCGYLDLSSSRSCYPSSKRAAESLCLSYNSEYGIEISIVRPCHVFGPEFTEKDNRAYAQFIRNAIKGENIVLKSSGSQVRSWCYVVDCAFAILKVLVEGQSGEAYNITEDNSTASILDLAQMIAEYGGSKVIYEVPSICESKGYNPVFKSVLRNNKIKGLGWMPFFSLEHGIKETINECLKTHKENG